MPIARNPPTTKTLPRDRSCCGVIEEATYQAREKRERNTKGQPWVTLKLMVGVTLGIMGYSSYVYIGRFCVKMIQRRDGGSRTAGSECSFHPITSSCLFGLLCHLPCHVFGPDRGGGRACTLVIEKSPSGSLVFNLTCNNLIFCLSCFIGGFFYLTFVDVVGIREGVSVGTSQEVADEIFPSQVTLTPPGFARDVCQNLPTCLFKLSIHIIF